MASLMDKIRALREERDRLLEENNNLKNQVDILIKNSESFNKSLGDMKLTLQMAVTNSKSIVQVFKNSKLRYFL